jgi:hypothetical protein
MGRNNADFHGITGPVHFAAKSKRSSIEKNGLKLSQPDFVEEPGDTPKGVYFYRGPQNAEYVEGHGSRKNADIYETAIPANYMYEDPLLPDDAVYHDETIPANRISRVGHTTSTGEIHWHPEEECRG